MESMTIMMGRLMRVSPISAGCGPVPQEVCNGVDDDCDGAVDEGFSTRGACGPTNTVEDCDGIDNNCNGQVDETVFAR